MIDAKRAMELADAEAANMGWGGVDFDDYDAHLFTQDGRQVWSIFRKQIVIGHQLRFSIDAETGAVIQKRRMGTR